MNKKQALKAATALIMELEEHVKELERVNTLYKADVQDYYNCIEGTVDGKSICEWCEDHDICKLKANGNEGCKEWLLRSRPKEEQNVCTD